MASATNFKQTTKDIPGSALNKTSDALLAWKSVYKHFPDSSFQTDSDSSCDLIIIHPIQSVNLIIEFCFHNSKTKEPPNVFVKSDMLPEQFVSDLETVLEMKCTHLTQWQTLGNEMEHILQKVSVTRKEKPLKNKKDKKSQLCNYSAQKYSESGSPDHNFYTQDIELDYDFSTYYKQKKTPRPNYFIAIRIQEDNIIQRLSAFQEDLVRQEELLTQGIIPKEALHFTLCNLGLDTADDLLKAIQALNEMKNQLQQILPKSSFQVYGASQFYNRAIYAKVILDEEFVIFRNVLMNNLENAGIEFREDHEGFTPHVTVIKVRRPERKAFGTRNIQPCIYEQFVDSLHGEQKVDAIHLCAMGGQKRDDGFYVTACDLVFTPDSPQK